jgi:hypothetical protein
LTEDLQGTQISSGQAKTMYVLLQTFPSTSGFGIGDGPTMKKP